MSQRPRDYSWAAFLDSMEDGGADAPGARTGRPAAGLGKKREQLVWSALAAITLTMVALWLGAHAGSFSPGTAAIARMTLSVLVVSLAGFAQGLTGFGFGLIAIALLPLLMNLKEAVALTALLNLFVCGKTFLAIRAHYSWRAGLGLVLGAGLGVPVGTCVLVQLDEGLLLRVLGSVMLLCSANELMLSHRQPRRLAKWLGFPFGLVSGALSGAFGTGGAPAIAFTYSQAWSKEQVVAALQVVFGLSALLRLLLLGNAGFLPASLLGVGLWSVGPLLVAIALG
ncbi:MAG: sulfite exporter TauE/SafE family protein, partial [Pedosphaera parvula]|nr:sulfite exporter TauE/SafE family protein [Pedosphaera parvula]